jgi:hypothetical protein
VLKAFLEIALSISFTIKHISHFSYSYQLKNSNDYVIWDGNLASGKSYTATFSPLDGDLAEGAYILYLQNSDGASSSYSLAAREELGE